MSKTIYTFSNLNIEGKKELPGLYLSDQKGAHWVSVLTDLNNRGVKNILVACESKKNNDPNHKQ